MSTIALDSIAAEALSTSVHNRIVQEGWTPEDDTALAEYIVMMLTNGKTQSQVATELAGELLQDAQGTEEFSRWLFDQIGQGSSDQTAAPVETATEDAPMESVQTTEEIVAPASIPAAYENDMTETPPDNAYVHLVNPNDATNNLRSPRGPRGSNNQRGGRGGSRGSKEGRGSDGALHRVRGTDRIGSHNVRGAPKGPRNLQNRPGMQKALNGVLAAPGGPQGSMGQNGMPNPNMPFSPEQQMQYLAMMEQQARLMAQWNDLQNGMNGSPQSRSLFDRVESGRGRGGTRGRGRGAAHQNGSRNGSTAAIEAKPQAEGETDGDAAMEGAEQTPAKNSDPAATLCHWNLRCTNKECHFAHQSPVAPMNIPVDTSQVCGFGVTCKNVACTARHPSPALKQAHQAESECKFYPNCTRQNCPFKHPVQPLCSYGASCRNVSCKFTHLQTMCKFSPCTNARCAFRHAEGQNRSFADYTWTPESAKAKAAEKQEEMDHVSDRKFISEAGEEEELIKPEPTTAEASIKEEEIT